MESIIPEFVLISKGKFYTQDAEEQQVIFLLVSIKTWTNMIQTYAESIRGCLKSQKPIKELLQKLESTSFPGRLMNSMQWRKSSGVGAYYGTKQKGIV